jgi:hypothetical protein
MAVVSTQRVGLDGEYDPSDKLFGILQPWSICTGENRRIKDEVSDITSVLVLTLKRIVAVGVSKDCPITLLHDIDPVNIIEAHVLVVVNVILSCLSANAVVLAFPANRSLTFVFVYMFGAEISPKKDDVSVISKYYLFNLFTAVISLPPTILLAAPMFLPPDISQLFINKCVLIVNPL